MVQHGMRHSSTKQMAAKLKGGLGAMHAKAGTIVHKPMHATESAKHNGKVRHPALHIETSSACSSDSTCGGSSEKGDSRATSPMMSASFVEQATFSTGSSLHHSGGCKPCAWYWKPDGCANERECRYCHLCLPGELKKRKRDKIAMLKQQKVLVTQQAKSRDFLCSHGQEPVDFGIIDAEPSIDTNMGMTLTMNSRMSAEQAAQEFERRITVKNTFIDVALSDLPTASQMHATNDFLMSAGVLFTASC